MATRTRKRPLTRERIVVAALKLVERDGLDAFSMRNLARDLGVEAMSLYHLFPAKQNLVDALVDHAIASVEITDEGAPVERLRGACHAYRAMAHRYARLYPVIAVHRLNTETGVRFIERILAIAREAAGDDERAARFFRAMGYYLMGAAMDETAGYAKGPSAAVPATGEFIARECPTLARSARWFQRTEWDATFERGLEAMLAELDSPR